MCRRLPGVVAAHAGQIARGVVGAPHAADLGQPMAVGGVGVRGGGISPGRLAGPVTGAVDRVGLEHGVGAGRALGDPPLCVVGVAANLTTRVTRPKT